MTLINSKIRVYSINESGFGYVVNSNTDSVNVHSINESESRFGFGESHFTCDTMLAINANNYR